MRDMGVNDTDVGGDVGLSGVRAVCEGVAATDGVDGTATTLGAATVTVLRTAAGSAVWEGTVGTAPTVAVAVAVMGCAAGDRADREGSTNDDGANVLVGDVGDVTAAADSAARGTAGSGLMLGAAAAAVVDTVAVVGTTAVVDTAGAAGSTTDTAAGATGAVDTAWAGPETAGMATAGAVTATPPTAAAAVGGGSAGSRSRLVTCMILLESRSLMNVVAGTASADVLSPSGTSVVSSVALASTLALARLSFAWLSCVWLSLPSDIASINASRVLLIVSVL